MDLKGNVLFTILRRVCSWFRIVISLIIWKTALLSQDLMFLSLIYAETILFQTVEGL
jgi:hypothetical protein